MLASSFTVSGAHGFLILIAFIVFLIAAVIAWLVPPRAYYAAALAVGLALFMFAQLWI